MCEATRAVLNFVLVARMLTKRALDELRVSRDAAADGATTAMSTGAGSAGGNTTAELNNTPWHVLTLSCAASVGLVPGQFPVSLLIYDYEQDLLSANTSSSPQLHKVRLNLRGGGQLQGLLLMRRSHFRFSSTCVSYGLARNGWTKKRGEC